MQDKYIDKYIKKDNQVTVETSEALNKHKATIVYDSRGETGNIFYILAKTREVLRKQNRITEYNDCWERIQYCDSYEEALDVIRNYVKLVDKRSKK